MSKFILAGCCADVLVEVEVLDEGKEEYSGWSVLYDRPEELAGNELRRLMRSPTSLEVVSSSLLFISWLKEVSGGGPS